AVRQLLRRSPDRLTFLVSELAVHAPVSSLAGAAGEVQIHTRLQIFRCPSRIEETHVTCGDVTGSVGYRVYGITRKSAFTHATDLRVLVQNLQLTQFFQWLRQSRFCEQRIHL